MNSCKFFYICAWALLLTSVVWGPANAEGGHCSFVQQSPKTKAWVKVCQAPTTPETCRGYAFDRLRGEVKYGEAGCSTRGVTGVCSMDGGELYFYEGEKRQLIRGCEMMNGVWREDVLERLELSR